MLLNKIDEFGKYGWITLVVLAFWVAWPLGLMLLAFLAGSGRLGWARYGCAPGAWSNLGPNAGEDRRRRGAGPWGRSAWSGAPWGRHRASATGNKAFDEYREETLRRLEEEEQEFQAFLD